MGPTYVRHALQSHRLRAGGSPVAVAAGAPPERWQSEVEGLFEAVAASVNLFAPTVTDTPVPQDADTGTRHAYPRSPDVDALHRCSCDGGRAGRRLSERGPNLINQLANSAVPIECGPQSADPDEIIKP